MLDSDTKRKIDTLRDILVGKIPNPQTQVEQITTGLIYKFMDDMDQESIEMGGEGSFFVGDYEKYAWKNLLDTKLSGVDKVNLYSQAIESMYLNPSAPQLFRDIFKNAFLPFKDPSTLKMFLKEINEFHYSHSEKLGDAFEYLISIMGSQGDAGQFRTPRHIINFIIEIIDPQKNETILDPACGTAGFLISSYKHILKTNTDKKLGDQLSAEDRKKVGENLTGYDISPEMIRLSLVNMYLHGFSTPKINEYDTLSSEDKWNEYFDVILANPPFFSPKGGIQPHKRFGVESKKAEVLFTSYILEHLKPNGRAGVIVPEGIIFQTGKAYKELRKQLVENGLIGVISLPAGIFQPYSGVKTSILILDKKLSKERYSIFFAKVKNDGYELGAQRKPIKENDLPDIINSIQSNDNEQLFYVEKSDLLLNTDCSFSQSKYEVIENLSEFEKVHLNEICSVDWGNTDITKSSYIDNGKFVAVSAAGPDGRIDLCEHEGGKVVISAIGANCGKVFFIESDFTAIKNTIVLHSYKESIKPRFLFYLLNLKNRFNRRGGGQPFLSKKDTEEFSIPLPPLEVQQEIVDELEGYQKIIDGCKQVVENYKPTIDIDTSWETVELGEVCEMIKRGITPKYAEKDGLIVINQRCIREHSINLEESRFHNINEKKVAEEKFVKYGDVLVNSTGVGTLGRVAQYIKQNDIDLTVDSHVTIVRPKEGYFEDNFFGYVMIMIEKEIMESGKGSSGQTELSRDDLSNMKISFPKDKSEQKEIVKRIEEERKVIEGNKKLIEIYTQKIQDRINKVWGED